MNKNEQKRDADGVEPVRPYIERIEGINTLSDLQEMAVESIHLAIESDISLT